MTNEVYRPYGCPWACLYDRRARTEETLRQVRQVHPRLLEPGGAAIPSTTYVTPADFVARGAPPTPVPPVVELDVKLTGAGELVRLRRLLGRWAGGHGADGDDPDDVMIAVGEAVTNALQHGAPPVRVQAFPGGGVARVRVHNPGFAAVFATAGYHRPRHRKRWRHRTLACPSTRRRRHHLRRHSGDDRRAELSHDGPALACRVPEFGLRSALRILGRAFVLVGQSSQYRTASDPPVTKLSSGKIRALRLKS